jgi:hypothetical protein
MNVGINKYMLVSSPDCTSRLGHGNSKQIVRKYVTVKKFGKTATNQHLIQEEIKRRMSFGDACYNSV